jgi:spore germination protein GerM
VRSRPVALAALGVSAVLAGGALAGCGVPLDAGPHRLAAGDLPLGLTAAPTTTTTGAGPPSPRAAAVIQVYLVAHDRLIARSRVVPSPATASEALGLLLDGATVPEAAFGVRSAIPAGTSLLGVHQIRGGRATVDLSTDFAQTGGADQILAIAQVVYTLTSLPDVVGVSFELAGQPVDVPTADGTLVSGPVGSQDFAALVAPGSS